MAPKHLFERTGLHQMVIGARQFAKTGAAKVLFGRCQASAASCAESWEEEI
jgi:hypothetical protein